MTIKRWNLKKMHKVVKRKDTHIAGFTLAELLIVVAIVGVLVAISIPIFTNQLEKAREATDLANVRAAYAELMENAIDKYGKPSRITVELKQKVNDWQTSLPITIGGVTYEGTDTDNWKGKPESGGVCILSYNENTGVVFTWKKASGNIDKLVTDTLDKAYSWISTDKRMNNNEAYFSGRTFTIDDKSVTVRVYYAGSDAFKDALASYTPTPTTYENSPFYALENDHLTNQSDGFAYYTYDDNGNIKEFTYVGSDKVYQTTDEGKTWQDITP